ncbi:MAG: PQQ-dependent dehydrogenase, methanol/ethanol family [Novosphingobium sp.]
MKWMGLVAAMGSAALLASAIRAETAAAPDALMRDGGAGTDWAAPGGTYGEQHYSPLDQIGQANVRQLGLVWSFDLPPGASVSQPLAVNGVLYVVSGYSLVRAIDVRTGKQLWEFDPQTWAQPGSHRMRLAWGTRGIAWWQGKIFVGTVDGRLIAIDAATGKEVWSQQTLKDGDPTYITGAPRVFDGKVIIGFGGADFGPVRGYVSTYDAETGTLLWRWYTVPGDPAKGFEDPSQVRAARTWFGEWWKLGGGGTAWNSFSYDPETRTVFVGVGNGSPWNHKVRSQGKGDNLYLASVVALDADSGAYKWHYQVNPGETWDFNAAMDMQFADLEIGGRMRKVVMTAPKNGFFYVLDRVTGELLSAEKFARANWAERIDLKTGRPVENPAARYTDGSVFTMWPSGNGAHNWYPMAFSPKTRLVYIPVLERAMTWQDFGVANDEWRKFSPVGTMQAATMISLPELPDDPINKTGRLVAWDPVAQRAVWSHTTPGTEGGSVMATGGNLVFQGQVDGRFNAYAADSGKLVWSFSSGAAIFAPPISYSVDGRQYVTVLTGISGHTNFSGPEHAGFPIDYRTIARRVLTFAIGGKARLPAHRVSQPPISAGADFKPDAAMEERGGLTFGLRCSVCHGFLAVPGGAGPDLRRSGIVLSPDAFDEVVRGGGLKPNGMPDFAELTEAQLADLRQYIRSRAAAAK